MTTKTSPAERAQMVRDYAAHANGSENLHRLTMGRMLCTDGVRYVAETCGAFWLIDLVGSHQMTERVRREPFQVWELSIPHRRRSPSEWMAECWTDTPRGEGSVELARQRIPYSDFPEELAPFKLYAEFGHNGAHVLMLPEER